MIKVHGNLIELTEEMLNIRAANQELHASNIANVQSANYKAKVPKFKVELDAAAEALRQKEDPFSIDIKDWKVDYKVSQSKAQTNQNGNNVALDQEMSAMTQNALNYMATLKILNKQLAFQRYALGSGQ